MSKQDFFLHDQSQREQALNIQHSFIVQAPAGSGKTELLTQRYLALLSQVQNPEEIIAITFTRKAAAEMRVRVIKALELAQKNSPPEKLHQQKTWQLARVVLKKQKEKNWDLLGNTARLRIQTFDALCASLTRQMPVLSHFGAQPEITDDPSALYQTAARSILATLEQSVPWTAALGTLLLHLDNNYFTVEKLLSHMLALREQWLPYLIQGFDQTRMRSILEKSLQTVIDLTLNKIKTHFPKDLFQTVVTLANITPDDTLPFWLKLSNLLLTQDDQWRKRVDKNQGFLSPSEIKDKEQKKYYQEIKKRMEALLVEFHEQETLRQCFIDLRNLPPSYYTDKQWNILSALFELLPILVAQLQLLFQSQGVVDYLEIAQNALTALGDPQSPTDLALALDYKIQHILIDEFQDTSVLQFRLLERLTAGWQPQDGRTIFLVGDPMQSIYRFRKAEVGLFLQACIQGIGSIPLQLLTLRINFRSNGSLVSWFNQTFQKLLPQTTNIQLGAVPYTPSITVNAVENNCSKSIYFHTFLKMQSPSEAESLTKLIQTYLIQHPEQSVAILVRARSHLREIIPHLQSAQIPYRALEIDALAERPVIQDLLALTRALLHLGDRIAWLAILRAPWCGLTLNDLHDIAHKNHQATVLELLETVSLSSEGQRRLSRVLPVFTQALEQKHRQPLAHWIKGTWCALGGPACLKHPHDLEDANAFFKLLHQLDEGGHIPDIHRLMERLQALFAVPVSQSKFAVDVMTIHKAKGLEFDHVILPSLERSLTADGPQLLLCLEHPMPSNQIHLLLAPIKASEEEYDPIYDHLRYETKKSADYETMRLLYVAATRAKKSLHLCGTFSVKEDKIQLPANNSLLGYLWPAVANDFTQSINITNNTAIVNPLPTNHAVLHRLPVDWQLPIADLIDI